jgi:endoglucanase
MALLRPRALLALVLLAGLLPLVAAAPPAQAVPPPFNYGEALQKSIWFYEAEHSGIKPAWNRVSWRGNSFERDATIPGAPDVSGGFHDAGDHIKATFPMSHSMAVLAWGLLEWQTAFTGTNQRQHLMNNLRWGMDWLIKGHPSANRLVALVGRPTTDHQKWAAAEVQTYTREAWFIDNACPGADLAAGTAAAFAASAMVFQASDPAYASTLLTHARQLYAFADAAPKSPPSQAFEYENCAPVAGIYESFSGYLDELVWGAIWLSRATGGTESAGFLAKAEQYYDLLPREQGTSLAKYKWTLDWDDKAIASEVLLAKLTGTAKYVTDVNRWADFTTDTVNGFNGQKATYSLGGEIFYLQWGSLRYAMGAAFLAFVAGDSGRLDATRTARLIAFAKRQTNYTLGDNPANLSYVVGFSKNGGAYVRRPHHRTEHGSWQDNFYDPVESRHTIYGALVGGPPAANDDYGAEDRNAFQKAEVALDFNAPLVGSLARMWLDHGGTPLAAFPPVETPDGPEMYLEGSINQQGTQPGPFFEVKAFVRNKSAWPARHLDNGLFRYYFTIDGGVSPSQVTFTSPYNQCSAPTGPTQFSGTTYYVQVSCAGQRISPTGQSDWRREVQFRIVFPAGSTHNFTQDWSYQGISTNPNVPAVMSRMTLHDGAAQIFGSPPGPQTPPSAPGQPTATNVTSNSLTLSWAASTPGSSPLAGYDVYRVGSPDTVVASTNATTTTANVTGLTPSTTYNFYVRARDTGGLVSTPSTTGTAMTLPPPTPPGPPGQPTSSAVTATSVTLSWTAATRGTNPIAGYDVYRVGTPDTVVASTTGLTATVTDLVPSTTYTFYVRARDTTAVSGTPSPTVTVPTAAATPPTAPTGLSASAITATTATLSWTASTPGNFPIARYEVWRVVGTTESLLAQTTGPTPPSLGLTGLTPDTGYELFVRARDTAGVGSAQSNHVGFTTPPQPPSTLRARYKNNDTSPTDNQIKPGLSLVNAGTSAVALSTVKLRYYFTKEPAPTTFSTWCDHAAVIGCATVALQVVALPTPVTGATHYLEVGFTTGAGSLAAGASLTDIQTRFNVTTWEAFSETNDYSYGTNTAFADAPKVTVYVSGVLVWGTPPA